MVKKKMIIKSNFNVAECNSRMIKIKTDETRSKEWINRRMKIFMNYTLQSVKMQTNQAFSYIIRYHDSTEALVKEALSKYDKLPCNVEFVRASEFKSKMLEVAEECDYLYMTRVDTDDMYHKSYIQQLYDFNPKENTRILINQYGYIYDSAKNNLLKVRYRCPPFYTEIIKGNNIKRDTAVYNIPIGHLYLYDKYPHEILQNYNYVWHIHSNNVSFSDYRYKSRDGIDVNYKNLITDSVEINKILNEFIGSIK